MKKILIIDDERSIRNALKEILEFEGFSVIDAEDGESGLTILKQQTIDLVFCDIKMPRWMVLKCWTKSFNTTKVSLL
jgi:YesN/AraC family two-component response regulator